MNAICHSDYSETRAMCIKQRAKFMSITAVSCHAIMILSQLGIFRGGIIIERICLACKSIPGIDNKTLNAKMSENFCAISARRLKCQYSISKKNSVT